MKNRRKKHYTTLNFYFKANHELVKTKAKIMEYNIIELTNQYHEESKNLDEIINSQIHR